MMSSVVLVLTLFVLLMVVLLCTPGVAQEDNSGGLPSNLPSPEEPKKKGKSKKAGKNTPAPRPGIGTNRFPIFPTPPSTTPTTPIVEIAYYDDNSLEDNNIQEDGDQGSPEYNEITDIEYQDYSGGPESQSPDAPPPPEVPQEKPPPEEQEESEEPPHRAIFGLDHIILIVVPSFKTKLPHLPDWAGSQVRVALPITVFFDKLTIHPPPLRPMGFVPIYGPPFPGGHYVKKRSVFEMKVDGSNELLTPSKKPGDLLKESVESGSQPTPRKPSLSPKGDVGFDESIYVAERVMLIPRLEKLLGSFGLGGKPCLLRAICETHEVSLVHHGYGLLGELLTLVFSISRSAFANTNHLSEYLEAEEAGKRGNCTEYFLTCPASIFYWEKRHYHNESQSNHSDQEESQHQNAIGLNDPGLEEMDEDDDSFEFNEIIKQLLSSRGLFN